MLSRDPYKSLLQRILLFLLYMWSYIIYKIGFSTLLCEDDAGIVKYTSFR